MLLLEIYCPFHAGPCEYFTASLFCQDNAKYKNMTSHIAAIDFPCLYERSLYRPILPLLKCNNVQILKHDVVRAETK